MHMRERECGHKGLGGIGLKFEGKSSWMHGSRGWRSPLTGDINRAQSERGATGGLCLQIEGVQGDLEENAVVQTDPRLDNASNV